VISRRFDGQYRAGCEGAPPPLHVVASHRPANYTHYARPLEAGSQPMILLPKKSSPVGFDPLDPTTHSRPYVPMAGMMGRFNSVTDHR
jgi:hypothetical protein